jgi:hypothetical protein
MVIAGLLAAETAHAASSDVAALQVALRAHGYYHGAVDGVRGRATERAVLAFQRHVDLIPDGIDGPLTRRALGRYGRPDLGARPLRHGVAGWDVAELQFLLAWHGFPSGPLDGVFGDRLQAALLRYQRWAGLPPVGMAGPRTVAALRLAPELSPMALSWPVAGTLGDTFRPRGDRFHAGVDIKAAPGAPVHAAAPGRVVWAGYRPGGWGNLVVVAHRNGVRTFYAHLSHVDVVLGQAVDAGAQLGLVGSTGHATGPHLHFEVRLRGAAVDPLPALEASSD